MTEERYALLSAVYCYCHGYHTGMFSREYRVICRLERLGFGEHHYRASLLNAEAKVIFGRLVRANQAAHVARERLARRSRGAAGTAERKRAAHLYA